MELPGAGSLDNLADFDGLLDSYLGINSSTLTHGDPNAGVAGVGQHRFAATQPQMQQAPAGNAGLMMPNTQMQAPNGMMGAPGMVNTGMQGMAGMPGMQQAQPVNSMGMMGMQAAAGMPGMPNGVMPTMGMGGLGAPGGMHPGAGMAAAPGMPGVAAMGGGMAPGGMPGMPGGMAGMGMGMPGMGGMPGMPGMTGMEGLMGMQQQQQQANAASMMAAQRNSITTMTPGYGLAGALPAATLAQQLNARGMAAMPGAAAPMPAMPTTTAAGGGGGGGGAGKSGGRSRGRSAGRNARRSEPDPGSSDGELDSNSDSASSDEEAAQKTTKKKREGGGGGGGDDAERRHAALQEKNRKAQRRFRERQKTKLLELHKQIEELTGKVSNLQTENAALHSRTSILEKVLDMRNEQIQVMQENKEVSEAELAGLGPGQALVPLTPEAIKEMSSEDIYRVYQTYVKELSVRLAAIASRKPATESASAGGDGSGADGTAAAAAAAVAATGEGAGGSGGELSAADAAAMADLERVVRELSVMLMRLGVARPLEARKFIVFSRQYLGNTEREVIELWKSVMKHIELTAEQMREIVELKRMFLTKIEPIMEERKHLNISIQTNLPHDTYHTKSSISYIKAHEAVSKLRDNLRSEQHVVLEFAIAVFRGVFKPQQMGTLLVRCYPAVPDALGIASALAAELGEPDSPATQQLAMQLGGYAVPGAQPSTSGSAGAPPLGSFHPSLVPAMEAASGGAMGAQLQLQQQAAAQQLLQQQHLPQPSMMGQQQQPGQQQMGMGMGMAMGMQQLPGQQQQQQMDPAQMAAMQQQYMQQYMQQQQQQQQQMQMGQAGQPQQQQQQQQAGMYTQGSGGMPGMPTAYGQ